MAACRPKPSTAMLSCHPARMKPCPPHQTEDVDTKADGGSLPAQKLKIQRRGNMETTTIDVPSIIDDPRSSAFQYMVIRVCTQTMLIERFSTKPKNSPPTPNV